MTTAPVMTITEELLAELQVRIETGGPSADPDETFALIDHIRSLTERLGMAKKALAPFAKCAELFDDDMRSSNMPSSGTFHSWPRLHHEYELTVEDLRAARYAIAQEGKSHE